MAGDPKVELISAVSLFAGCSRGDLSGVAGLMDEVDVPAGYVLMQQGDIGREMFVIVSGRVVIERDGQQINELGPGGVVGEMALISEAPRSATVRVVEPARLLVAGHREFHSLMDANPTIRMRVLEGMATKIRNLETNAAH
jgi:CRP-like cAMP-binding protein